MLKLNKGEYTGKIVSHMNVAGSLITNTVYTLKKSDPFWHSHKNLHISFVFEGGQAETKKSAMPCKKGGSIFFYHSGQIHRWIPPPPKLISKSVNIEIDNVFLKKFNLLEEDIKKSLHKNINAKALILKMQKELQLHDVHSLVAINSLLLELINYSKISYNADLPTWAKNLHALLNDNWNVKISLSDMSNIVGVHPITISKYFRKYFSCTLGEYQRKLKINRSIDLIKNSKLTFSDIAYQCGFSDQSHFTRNFKEQTNFLPKEFRRL